MPAYLMQIRPRQEPDDCARVALAMYLGETYEDVLRATTKVDAKNAGKGGLTVRAIIRVAAELGHTLKHIPIVNFHHDFGILILKDHVVVLRNGLVFDADSTVCDACYYMPVMKYRRHEGILVEDDTP